MEISVRVRDIGMVGLPDSVILKTGLLTAADWQLVQRHPVRGAELLETLAPIAAAAAIVRAHHERWDGEGYPDGLIGDAIPLLSRVIAVCDAFVAMAVDRPYRRGVGAPAALEQIRRERDAQFDPQITDVFVRTVAGAGAGRDTPRGEKASPAATQPRENGRVARTSGRPDLASALVDFDVVPAFAPACERALAACDGGNVDRAELVATIESDTGLTVAILRKAQEAVSGGGIANVPDALAALSAEDVQDAVRGLPRAQFPWRTSPLEVLMHHSRIHAQAVTRAADRIARELRLVQRDDLLAAALLHDVGKLVLSRVGHEFGNSVDTGTVTPEHRVHNERLALGIDHASLGGRLLRRWRLPVKLADAVEAHHSTEAEDDVATYVRLADMLAHHAQGDAIDRTVMLRVAGACGLSTSALRDVMFDLPHTAGSRRRRSEASPLSSRQTEVLHLLAEGKVYKQIALELGIAESTIRTHLHQTYEKLGVGDRAQAVLRATEEGWI